MVPELNDDFAKEVGGGAQTLEELQDQGPQRPREAAEKPRPSNEEREALIKALVERNPFEVPKAMVERAIDLMLEGALRAMARRGMDPRSLGLDFTACATRCASAAVHEVKGTLLFEAIAEKESIQADRRRTSRRRSRSWPSETGQPARRRPQVLQAPGRAPGLSCDCGKKRRLNS